MTFKHTLFSIHTAKLCQYEIIECGSRKLLPYITYVVCRDDSYPSTLLASFE